MSGLGKIFIYEQNPQTLHQFSADLEAQGFFIFGTDNIYQLLKYAQNVKPDIVIINTPADFQTDDIFWAEVKAHLCEECCPQIYVNTSVPFSDTSSIHYTKFNQTDLDESQLIKLIKDREDKAFLN